MKYKHTRIALLGVALFLLTSCQAAPNESQICSYPLDRTHAAVANELQTLGLLKGVDGSDLGLNRPLNRVEGAILLVRLSGLEPKGGVCGTVCYAFQDVPDWASVLIDIAYDNKLIQGLSPTEFGTGNMTAPQYMTLLLRLLGYQEEIDFSSVSPEALAKDIGLLTDAIHVDPFLRSDAILLTRNALDCREKGKETTLATRLMAQNVFTQEAFAPLTAEGSQPTPNATLSFSTPTSRFPLGTKELEVVLRNNTKLALTTGYPYKVQRQTTEGWIDIPLNLSFILPALRLSPGDEMNFSCALPNDSYSYEPGLYRIEKSIVFADQSNASVYAEFTLM